MAAGRASTGPRGGQNVKRTATSAAATAASAGAGAGAGAGGANESSSQLKCTTAGGQARVQSAFPRRGLHSTAVCACIPGGRGRRASSIVRCLPGASSAGIPAHQTPQGSAPGPCLQRRGAQSLAPRASRPRLMPPDPFPPNSHSLHRPTRAAGLMPFTAAGAGPGVAPAAPGSRPARAARGSRGERSTLQLPRLRLSHTAQTCKEWCKCKRRQAVRLRITRCAPRLCRSTHERKPRNNNRKA